MNKILIPGNPPTPGPASSPAAAVLAEPTSNPSADEPQTERDLRRAFIASLPAVQTELRGTLQELSKAENEGVRSKHLQKLCHQTHLLVGKAAVTNFAAIAHLAEALEALLEDLRAKPKSMTMSPLRTLASAIDTLGRLFERVDQPQAQILPPAPRILVVDDEPISRRAVMKALEKAKLPGFSLGDSTSAYSLLAENAFDLVFLDVDMPGLNGFELCAKLRDSTLHKRTPIVFVTTLDDFESRASSTVSGGTDFIAKPFLFVELAVKALVYLVRDRVARSF